jgi:hypothetical protein
MTRWRATAAAAGLACGLGVSNTAVPDSATSYWFVKQPDAPDSTEALPLVSVRAGVISPCDKSCLHAARKGAHIRSVRMDGGLWDDNRVTGLRRSDTKPSPEIVLAAPSKAELFVNEGYRAHPVARAGTLGAEGLREMEAFVRPIDDLVIDRSARMIGTVPPLPRRLTIFPFTVNGHESQYAVIAGPSLAIAAQNARRQWVLQHLEQATAPEGFYAEAFHLVAIVDMDGDGLPEIIAVKQMGESWWHLVLHYKADGESGGGWTVVATVPGSTV